MRWGLGPVFIYECLTSSRRWQNYAARSLGVSVLLVAMATIAWSNDAMLEGKSTREYAKLGEAYFYALIGVELALVMFGAPAATASAICLDRSRGTLAHVLATDLSDPEIVLGKLAARLLPALGLVACTWPVLSITSLLGGIDPVALTMAFAVIVAVALLGCTLSLALSVWARKPHEVVLATYTIWIVDLLVWPIWMGLSASGRVPPPSPWAPVSNPFYLAFAPYAVPGRVDFWHYLGFFAATLGASGVFTVLAVWRMRPVACRAAGRNQPRLGLLGRLIRRLPGPSLDRNPVLWREWHRSRPSPWMMSLLMLVGGTTGIACLVGAVTIWANGFHPYTMDPGIGTGIYGYVLQVLFGLLMLSAVAPISISDERQRGSLDVLAATSLSTRTIVLGKWWGTFRLVPLLAIGPGLMAVALATGHKFPPPPPPPGVAPYFNAELSLGYRLFGAALVIATILAHGALLTSIGLALATWIKRQSRAVGISVGLFVLVAVGWPVLVHVVLRSAANARGAAALSPIFCAGFFADILTIRSFQFQDVLWWAAFWVVEVILWAAGLLWLTIRTFDRCFGRMPERARTSPLLPDLIVLWAGTTAIACAARTFVIWGQGVATGVSPSPDEAGIVAGYLIMVILDLLVIAIVAPMSISEERRRGSVDLLFAAPHSAGTVVLGIWWRTFRLVALLAIGPGLVALALATAPEVSPLTMPATNVPDHVKIALGIRLYQSALLILAILAHGAAMASVGLVLSMWIKQMRRAIAMSVCFFVLTVLAWPILVSLLASNLMTRVDQRPHVEWWATLFVIAVALLAIALLALAIQTFDRCLARKPQGVGPIKTAYERGQSAVETLFAGD